MTREVVCEYATRGIGTNFGFFGGLSPGDALHCMFHRIDGDPGIEAISSRDRNGWTIVAIGTGGGELARLRGRNWFFDPIAGMEILLPHRAGVRLAPNPLLLLLSLGRMKISVPAPIARSVRFRRRRTGMSARWEACENEGLDQILMTLVAFRFWLELNRASD